ncbi:PDZK1-interacting protein 1 isoform X1 [Rattus norvegicus]
MLPSSWAPYSGPGYLGQTVLQLISYKHSRPPAAPGVKTPAALQLPAAMLALSLLALGLLAEVAPASCQQGLGNLQPWMQGLIAVAVFLVLVAIAFAVNHFWCQEEQEPGSTMMITGNKADGVLVGMDGRYSSMASGFRSSEHKNAFENVLEEEGRVRSTPM